MAQDSLVPSITLGMRVFLAKLSLLIEKTRLRIAEALRGDSSADIIDMRVWNPCVFEGRESLMGKYVRYDFKIPEEDAFVPLPAGQEVNYF